MKKQFFLLILTSLIILSSCNKDENIEPTKSLIKGMLIANEGGFNKNNGSVSLFNIDSLKAINDYFRIVNNRPLGDIVQSVTVFNKKAYIVVNNSQKVEVVDIKTFKSVATITGVNYPRYFIGINENKGYLTNGNMKGKVYVINLNTYSIEDSIEVGNGPENLIKVGDYVYVANSGGWTFDSTVTVINSITNKVVNNIKVGHCPTDLVEDKNGNIWVLCKGIIEYDWNTFAVIKETPSKIVKINTTTKNTETELTIGNIGDYYQPTRIAISKNKDILYFTEKNGIFKTSIETVNQIQIISGKDFYGLEVCPFDGIIYGFYVPNFNSQGYLFRYNESGSVIDSFELGIAPNGGTFFEEEISFSGN